MNLEERINDYINSHEEPKRSDMHTLHALMLTMVPASTLWFLDGTNDEGKIVANPNIGYESQIIKYGGKPIRLFYKIGISGNKTGISVYIMGLKDKKYLAETYGKEIGKATVGSYCIKFKKLKDINLDILKAAIRYGLEH